MAGARGSTAHASASGSGNCKVANLAGLPITVCHSHRGMDLTPLTYPLHDWTGTVTHCGRICYKSRKVNLSQVFAGQDVGVKQVDDHLWLVTFMDYDLGYFDDETCRLEPIDNPFGPKVLPLSPE